MKNLTPRQIEILQFIDDFIRKHHYAPSYREIMEHFDWSSLGSVYRHVQTLKKKGALATTPQSHRSLQPAGVLNSTTPQEPLAIEIPLIGNVSIGYPLELFMQSKMIALPASLIHSQENTYLLQVQGDALLDEHIQDGDLLLIEARQEVHPGEIILGLINQTDSFLKRYYPEGQYIRLESQNNQLGSLIVRSELVTIQGALIGLLRIY